MAIHSPLLISLAIGNLVFFIINQLFGALNMAGVREWLGIDINIFGQSMEDASNQRYLEITPSSATFSIWGAIYIWQAVWAIYALVNICRRTPDGYVYNSPTLLSATFFGVSILNWMCVITWTFVWGWGHVWIAFVFLAIVFITIYICIGLSYKALAQHHDALVKQGRKVDIWLMRMLVQNGLAFYGAWCTIATLLNLAMALTYTAKPQFDQSTSSTIALSILSVELTVFAISDWTIMDKYSRYTFSPYIVVMVALSGSMVKNWNPEKTNSIFTAVLLGVSILCFITKMVLMFWRHCRDSNRDKVELPTITEKQSTSTRL
ncbi:uncharacterized protein [Haliotis cracherodii]|uniref:uncharacterized protein n=1 Tax=Haliotis cracherodii TaxID=6455 RepID=UPI0039EA6866